jgi:hypothetical protein
MIGFPYWRSGAGRAYNGEVRETPGQRRLPAMDRFPGDTTTNYRRGWDAVMTLRDADRALLVDGNVSERNRLLRSVPAEYWNGREIIPEADPVICPACGMPDCRPVVLLWGCPDCGCKFTGPAFPEPPMAP